jgi:hypothetical protein
MSAPIFANPPESLGVASNGHVPAMLEQEVRRIYARSPLYGQRFPLRAEPLEWSSYREIPALSKREIVERGHRAFFADYAEIERTLWDETELGRAMRALDDLFAADPRLAQARRIIASRAARNDTGEPQ